MTGLRNDRALVRTLVVLAAAAVAWSTRAAADPQPTEADQLFEEGRTLAKAGNYAEACERFTRSFALDHAPGTELNLGDCQQHLGHTRVAWKLFVAAAADFERDGEATRAKFARDRAAAAAKELAMVVVHLSEPELAGLAVSIAGADAKPLGIIRDRVEPGDIVIAVSAPGRHPYSVTTSATAGATVDVEIPALAVDAAPFEMTDHRHARRVHLAWWLGGGAGATAIASVAFTLIGRSRWQSAADGSHCARVPDGISCDTIGQGEIRDAQRIADIGTGFAIGAGALAAAAAIVYFTAPTDTKVVVPSASAQGVGISVVAHF